MTTHAQAFARYAALVTRQLEALELDELHELDSIADERAALQEEIEELGAFAPLSPEHATELREALAAARRSDGALRQQLRTGREAALEAIRAHGRARPALTAYAAPASPRTAIDITF